MTSWDIDPAGVQGVLARTTDVAAGFDPALQSMSSAIEGAATAGASGPVASALSGFATALSADVEFVYGRTSSAVQGCVGAVNAYSAGDLEMAATAQANATAAPGGQFGGTGGGPGGVQPR
ncbi:DUF6507 family protein [Blastococcus sp. SYSU D00813]